MVTGKSQAQTIGQASPAPFQTEHHDQTVSFSDTAIGPKPDSLADNSSDRKDEVENDRTQKTKTLFQGPESGIQRGIIPADSFSGLDTGPDNRNANFEVKNGISRLFDFDNSWISDWRDNRSLWRQETGNQDAQSKQEIAPSARLTSPANQASFDAGNYSVPHVQNDQEKQETATCAKSPEVEEKPNRLTGRELANWAMENYAVDPIQNSKNRWRIRLRCRKTGCKHEGHLGLKTVSFMSDSAFKKLTKSGRKYELWKKSIIAENAAKCHGYGGSSSGRNDERRA